MVQIFSIEENALTMLSRYCVIIPLKETNTRVSCQYICFIKDHKLVLVIVEDFIKLVLEAYAIMSTSRKGEKVVEEVVVVVAVFDKSCN